MDARVHFVEKMEAVSRLAGGVAHQFNNLLTAILSTADLALEVPSLDAAVRQDLQDIREAARRAASLTRQLLVLSGSQPVALRRTTVNELLAQLEPLLRHVLVPNVTLDLRFSSESTVETDPLRLEQVIITLVAIAVDACAQRGGGSIAISADDVGEVPHSETTTGAVGPHTRITIADTGLGMDESDRARAFEPFFSPKESTSGGIGLGLAAVYGTMQQLGGGVALESALGEGTRVSLFLPRIPTPAPPLAVDCSTPKAAIAAAAVLVVEDEPVVRAPMCRMLRNLGYFVLEANNGEDALLVMHAYHAPVHLVVTDVVMGDMGGPQLVELLREWYPRTKVLFISGFGTEYLEAHGGPLDGSAFLAKPFSMKELATRVRDMLDTEWSAL